MNKKEYAREWRQNNKERQKEYRRRHIAKHGVRILSEEEKLKQKEYMKIYGRKNRAELREKKKLQIANNPEYAESLRRSKKAWQDNNKGYTNQYNKNRRKVDLNFKLRMYLRGRIRNALKGKIKQGSAVKDLGCTIKEFILYLESKFDPWMSWQNYGHWEIDHVKPLSKFDLAIKEEFLKACHYTNMQPLWKLANRVKRDIYLEV